MSVVVGMKKADTFPRRGIVEGFFGPPWSMAHRRRVFTFGAARGMNTYLYAPKDDPYHREKWRIPYPRSQWQQLTKLIRAAQRQRIDFVYGFHPGKGLCFSDPEPIAILLNKAHRFYEQGVRTFAVLFDDIPSRLEHASDRRAYRNSLARAQGVWLEKIQDQQPAHWRDVEWWICPSYYTPDPLLAKVFGRFEPRFLAKLAEQLPANVACLWTGPAVVPKEISRKHIRQTLGTIQRRLILWDNYPVNDLSMSGELHIGPLVGREARLQDSLYGYLNNPLLQEALGILPLATCFDYAQDPCRYRPEASWRKAVSELYGPDSLPHWQTIRRWCQDEATPSRPPTARERIALDAAVGYIHAQRLKSWARELRPWMARLQSLLNRR